MPKINMPGKSAQTSGNTFLSDVHHHYFNCYWIHFVKRFIYDKIIPKILFIYNQILWPLVVNSKSSNIHDKLWLSFDVCMIWTSDMNRIVKMCTQVSFKMFPYISVLYYLLTIRAFWQSFLSLSWSTHYEAGSIDSGGFIGRYN